MAIRIIEGVPGSGKTYYAVNHLLKNYYIQEDGFYEKQKSFTVVSNIEGLELEHYSIDDWLEKYGGKEGLFNYQTQSDIMAILGSVIYVIDEAQVIFDRKFYDRNVFEWFEKHRHLGQDIYLISQNSKKLPPDVVSLVEYIIRASPRTRSLTGHEFRYKHLAEKDVLKNEVLKLNKDVFAVYKSQSVDETEKPKNPFIKKYAFLIVASLGFVFWAWNNLFSSWQGESEASVITGRDRKAQVKIKKNNSRGSGQSSRSKASSNNKNDNKNDYENIILSYVMVGSKLKIIFDGRIYYSMKEFPYEINVRGRELIARVPVD